MTRRNSILCIAVLICVLFPAKVQGDEPDTDAAARERHLQLLAAESDLKIHELEVAVSKHSIEEAEVEAHIRYGQGTAGSGRVPEEFIYAIPHAERVVGVIGDRFEFKPHAPHVVPSVECNHEISSRWMSCRERHRHQPRAGITAPVRVVPRARLKNIEGVRVRASESKD